MGRVGPLPSSEASEGELGAHVAAGWSPSAAVSSVAEASYSCGISKHVLHSLSYSSSLHRGVRRRYLLLPCADHGSCQAVQSLHRDQVYLSPGY